MLMDLTQWLSGIVYNKQFTFRELLSHPLTLADCMQIEKSVEQEKKLIINQKVYQLLLLFV